MSCYSIFVAKFYRKALYRPTASPTGKLLLAARSVGHYRVRTWHRENAIRKHFTQVFWGVAGDGNITWEGKSKPVTHPLKPGTLAVYFPGDLHDLEATGETAWEYRWWTMDGALAAQITKQLGFARGEIYRAGEAPTAGFRAIERNIRDITPAGEMKASASAYSLLLEAASRIQPSGKAHVENAGFSENVLTRIHNNWNDPQFDVNTLADHLGIHRTVLSKRFHHLFGMPPVEYMARLRIQNAMTLLKQTDLPIQEIAKRCGWSDPNYFARRIRQSTGAAPGEFRRGV